MLRWATAVDDGPLRLFTRDGPGWPFYARPAPGRGPVAAADLVFLAAGDETATRVYERVGFRRAGECALAAPTR